MRRIDRGVLARAVGRGAPRPHRFRRMAPPLKHGRLDEGGFENRYGRTRPAAHDVERGERSMNADVANLQRKRGRRVFVSPAWVCFSATKCRKPTADVPVGALAVCSFISIVSESQTEGDRLSRVLGEYRKLKRKTATATALAPMPARRSRPSFSRYSWWTRTRRN